MIHKTTRSILSVLLAVLLLVTSIPLTPAFADGGAVSLQSESGEGRALTGSGTKSDPYKISTAAELREFAQRVNGTDGNSADPGAHAKLMNDIDLNGSEENPWTPIGSDSNEYTGTFDGNGKTISGLYISSSSDNYQGLFGYLSTDGDNNIGTVKDLTVSGSVSGGWFVGGIVGYNNGGTVTGCTFSGSGSVSGNSYVGGVVGVVGDSSGTVKNCYNTGDVTGGSYVGGVVGQNFGGTVENCYNTGNISGNISVGSSGGVVGWNSGTVENCYNTGSVTSSGSNVGGVVGYNVGPVKNCYNTGAVSGSGLYVGGVVGYNRASVTNCYNTGTASSNSNISDVGGVVGYNSGNVTGCYFLQSTAESGIGDGSGEANAVDDLDELCEKFENDNTNTWTISDTLNRPVLKDNHEDDGSEQHPYRISTATQLETFRDLVNGTNNQTADPDAHAVLMDNIDLNPGITFNADGTYSSPAEVDPQEWTPIGNEEHLYTGTFDGNGKTIENLYINNTTSDEDQGLFGNVSSGGKIEKLVVSGSVTDTSSNSNDVGGIVGQNFGGTVTGCAFSGTVTSSGISGGVVGDNGGTVKNCYNTGTVTGTVNVIGNSSFVGGVVGENYGSVTNCYNTGSVNVTGNDGRVGGVVGWNSGNVTNCYNTGGVKVTGNGGRVGGVVGLNSSGDSSASASVTNCYNTGKVTGSADSSDVGGVVGLNSSASVANCYYQTGKGAAVGIGGTTGDNSSQTAAKSLEDFHSGEVAYLLEKGVTDEKPVWGQDLTDKNSLPTLVALDKANAQKVYRLTFNWNMGDQQPDTVRYTNGSVTLPADNEIPTRTGYHISGWKDKNGQPVTAGTTVGEDADFTAEWTENTYTITVTAGSGGAVSGGGTFAEGTQVTVTATANDGYTFVAWQEGGTKIENAGTSYTFTVNGNRSLTAVFEKDEDPTPTPTPTPDPTPSGPSTGDSSGWDDIRDELENAEKGDEITIDMGDETKVPAEIFESLAGKDVEISFDLGDIQWSVNGADIPEDADFTDIDMGVTMNSDGIPVDVVNAITGEVGTVQMTLAHDGDFGFTMTLTAPLGAKNAGYWANLYHYDEDADQLTFETAAEIDADGNAALPMSHASQYAIVIDTHSHATVDVSDLFTDVAPNAWYKDAIQYAYDNGLMTGVSATEFAPEQTTTRAMIVSILARLEGVTTAQAAGFNDVNDEWYATAVNWAASVGVVNGYEDNTFQPNTAITREQLAAILMNYAAYKGEDVSNRADLANYTDQPSTWAQEAMSWAVAEGLISGVTADTLQPQGAATRAQVAAILQRFLSE